MIKNIYFIRVADTEDNKSHPYWKDRIGEWVSWRQEDPECLGFFSMARWESSKGIFSAKICDSKFEANIVKKDCKKRNDLDIEIVKFTLDSTYKDEVPY